VAGLVLLIPGLESTKEQFTTYEPYFLERGLATLSFEGPGQGEAWYSLPFRDDAYARAVAAVGEAAAELSPRVVVVGTSFGGYLALRCAAAVPGLAAVVSISGRHDLSDFDAMEPVVQEGFARITKCEDPREVLAEVNLAGKLDDLRAPALVLHGRRDRLVPDEQMERIAAALGDRAELWIEAEGSHSCNNLHTRVRPALADWVRERLEASA
jgi:2,6-dihydroxypseudooxynicotine hydrolase